MSRLTFFLLVVFAGPLFAANELHPEFPLLDAVGDKVVESGTPLSMMTTCGECHDTAYIVASSDHADAGASMLGQPGSRHVWASGPGYFGGWDPLRYDTVATDEQGRIKIADWLKRYGSRHIGGGPVADLVEMNCLLCHSDLDGHSAREVALRRGDFAWANSVSLASRDILLETESGWQWNASMFNENGALLDGLLDIRKPNDENCALCHGQVSNELENPLTISHELDSRIVTERTGQIISPQKIFHSGLNIAGKEELSRPFDVHSDRVLGCVDCHYSLNNPVYFRQRDASRPAHLNFDPRRLTSSDYLTRPLHQFAKGKSIHGLAATASENSLRRCESCHDATQVHGWLPYKERHFASLACETCHIPELFGPTLQTVDWTMLNGSMQPLTQYRNTDGEATEIDSLIYGFRPLLLPRTNGGGTQQLAPFNLITSWFWTSGNPVSPVTREALQAALFEDGRYHPDILRELDADGDGHLIGEELRLTSADKLDVVRRRLEANGLPLVKLASEITPFTINHNIVNGKWATRQCGECHVADSVLAEPFALSDYQPGGKQPVASVYSNVALSGAIQGQSDGVVFVPDSSLAGFYIIGLHGVDWVDLLGLLLFLGVSAGVAVHATGRWVTSRQRQVTHHKRKRVYMYDTYERLWHWLQASAILLLLFTGLAIHKPHFFGMFSFPYLVQVHNVLGFVLLINAALALFYNLASGEIRQYFPEPKGFIGRSMAQAMYYSRGIFAGEPHPVEKTRENKLNPLQQVTFLAILHVLLPAQIITGSLIWGMQKWPEIAQMLGGLPVLAPLHTFIAWAFATFIVMHVYLTTAAGENVTDGIKAMIQGWEDVEVPPSSPQPDSRQES